MPYQFQCPRDGCCFELRCDADHEAARLARAHARVAHRDRIPRRISIAGSSEIEAV